MMKEKHSPFKFAVGITLVITVLLIALVVVGNINSNSNETTALGKQPSIDDQPTLGEPDAPVTVVEFGDFKCPACKAWGKNIFPQLESDYVETGKVTFSFVNVLFHGEESKLASQVAELVYQQNPDAYWEFHKALFNEQPENHDSTWVTKEKIVEVAGKVSNIDTEKLETDLENGAAINRVNQDRGLVTEFDVQQTPTIMVNDTMIEDPFDYEAIQKAIEDELEGNG